MSASLGLFRLQQVDRKIDRARSQLETIRKTLENDTELRECLTRAETAKASHHHAHHNLKSAEMEVETQKIKIEQTDSSLYGGRVQNPKELQDLQKEIVSLKKHLATLEERELEAMLAAETAEQNLQAASTQLELIQARLGSEHTKLLADQNALAAELEQLIEEREATLSPLDTTLLQIYEDLRQQKRGIAVTEITDNSCAACGGTLNSAIQQSARSQKLANCPTCGRILYSN